MRRSRPRNSFGPSCRPPHDERRRLRASVVARLGGGAAHLTNAGAWRGRERASHQTRSLPDLWLLIVGPVALDGARVVPIGDELGPDVARVRRLAHPLPSPLRREELLHREDGASRQHVEHGASDLVRQDRERLPFAVLSSQSSRAASSPSVWRRNSTAASENAHFKWTFPIFAPPVPSFFPPDCFLHLTSRA